MDELVQDLARKMYNDPSGWVAIIAMLSLPILSFLSSIVSAGVSDGTSGWRKILMRFVNALAVNVGKAKNDPTIQRVFALVAILPAVALLSGCAVHFNGQTPNDDPIKASFWTGFDMGNRGYAPDPPDFNNRRFVDVDGRVDFLPPAVMVGIQVKPIAHTNP